MANPNAGWYPDPEGTPRLRWWDGENWGELRDSFSKAGWYPDETGAERWWDGASWGAYKLTGTPEPLTKGRTIHIDPRARAKLLGAVLILVLLLGGGFLYASMSSKPPASSLTWVVKNVDPTMGSMWGSTKGLEVISHLPGGLTEFKCLNGSVHYAKAGVALKSPCA